MRPLAGIRVLDMSRVLSGPFAGRILSDLGADVVKVEPPEGDISRLWGVNRAGLAGFYTQQNVGKRNVCIDLRAEGGPETVKRLAAQAQVLVENFRPGVMARHGLSFAELAEVNPALVMLSISGFGQEGPESQRAAYAAVLHGEAGWMDRTAYANQQPLTEPHLAVADTTASMHGAIGVLAALRVAEQTGHGQHVDIAMLEAFLATDEASQAGLDGGQHRAQGGLVWEGTDGPVLTAGDFRHIWRRLSETHGIADPSPPGADIPTKRACRTDAINAFLSSFATRAQMLAALDAANLAWGDIRTTAEAHQSPTALHRGSSVEIDARDGGTRRVTQTPYRFTGVAAETSAVSGVTPAALAPHLGEHNGEVLAEWLGAGRAEVDALRRAGVLIEDASAADERAHGQR